jgi:DNA damage-binding protein 1
LYLFGEVNPKYIDLLINFQTNLSQYVVAPGKISFDMWRAFRNQVKEGEGPYRFLDGEMLERFLDLNEGSQEMVCEGLGPSVEYMRNIIENLKMLH